MKKQFVIIASGIILISVVFNAEISHAKRNKKVTPMPVLIDGEYWRSISKEYQPKISRSLKIFFLKGLLEGNYSGREQMVSSFAKQNNLTPDWDKMTEEGMFTYPFPRTVNLEELISDLDKFYYKDKKNKDVWVMDALSIISMQKNGVPKKEIDEHLEAVRKRGKEGKRETTR